MMRLEFETNGGASFHLDVSTHDTLQEIKRKIQITHGIPILAQTLSFNGNIIATDADLRSAAIADGSLIHLDIAAPEIQLGNLPAAASTSRGDAIYVSFQFGEWKELNLPVAVNSAQNASQLRSALQEITGVETPASLMFFCKDKRVEENRSFEAQQIGDGDTIEIPKNTFFEEMGEESRQQIRNQALDFVRDLDLARELDSAAVVITVKVDVGDETITVEVRAAEKVEGLRVKLADIKQLPTTYSFLHKAAVLNEELSFRDQNVGDGDLIQIVYS